MTHLFISYVREDRERVDRLCKDLRRRGIKVWLDRDQILPGQRWRQAVRRAIKDGAFFLACFSKNYLEREKSFMNEELVLAVEELRLMPAERNWFIPVLLDKCLPPDRPIGAGETLRSLEWVALYEDWERELERLLKSLRFQTGHDAAGAIREDSSQPIAFAGEKISLELSEVRLADLAAALQENLDKNIVVYPKWTPKVTAWGKLPWDEALFRVCRDLHYGVREEGAVIRIAPLALLETEDRLVPLPPVFFGEPVDVKLKNASFFETMEVLTEAGDLGLYIGSGITDFPVTINIKGVPLDQARDLICRMNGLGCRIEESTFVVSIIGNQAADS